MQQAPKKDDGRFSIATLVLVFGVFAVATGWTVDLIAWLRADHVPTAAQLRYGLLFGTYAALTAAVMLFALRRSGENASTVRALLPAYVLSAVCFILFRWIGDQILLPLFGRQANYPESTGFLSFALDNLTYSLVPIAFGAVIHLLEAQRRSNHQRRELLHQQRLSELSMLRARVAPHFLFNTLNNLYALSQRPGADLSRPIHDLAQLMRHVVKHDAAAQPLRHEWDLLTRYVDLQRLRYDRPLQLRFDADDDALHIPVTGLILLPLVENAFKHGDPCDAAAPLTLTVRLGANKLLVHCSNRIARTNAEVGPSTGIGDLSRLLQLSYGEEASTHFATNADGRFIAELSLPLKHHG